MTHAPKSRFALILALGACSLAAPGARTAFGEDGVTGVTAVSSQVSDDYVRAKLPGGGFQPETYAFGEGGRWGGAISDKTFDGVRFTDVAHVVARPLADQNYLPAKDPRTARLLIMVYWGTTKVSDTPEQSPLYFNYGAALAESARLAAAGAKGEADDVLSSGEAQLSMANRITDHIDFDNAAILGYDTSGLIGTEYGQNIRSSALGLEQRDQVADVEENRYFVVLMAYDFQILWKSHKHKLVWETRFSINERHNAFDKALPVMAQAAAPFFGRASHGLLRDRVPEGNVLVKDPSVIEFLSSPRD
jgi:hypothetical protein